MLKASQTGTGGGVAIGDIVESQRSEMPDGRRLLPLNGQLIEALEYPILEPLLEETMLPVMTYYDTKTARMGAMNPTKPEQILISYSSQGLYKVDVLADTETAVSSGFGYVRQITYADDGLNSYYIGLSNGPATVVRTTDNWLTTADVELNASGANVGSACNIQCDSTGQNVLAVYVDTSDIVRIYESSDFGVSFTVHPRSGELTVSSDTVSTLGRVHIHISTDLQHISIGDAKGSDPSSLDIYISSGGAAFVNVGGNLSIPNTEVFDEYFVHFSDDGATIVAERDITTLGKQRGYAYSTDRGQSFTVVEQQTRDGRVHYNAPDTASNQDIRSMLSSDGQYLFRFAQIGRASCRERVCMFV